MRLTTNYGQTQSSKQSNFLAQFKFCFRSVKTVESAVSVSNLSPGGQFPMDLSGGPSLNKFRDKMKPLNWDADRISRSTDVITQVAPTRVVVYYSLRQHNNNSCTRVEFGLLNQRSRVQIFTLPKFSDGLLCAVV